MHLRIARPLLAVALATAFSLPAHAGIPVIDVANLASNVIQNFQLAAIKHSLNSPTGMVVVNTTNIDKSTRNIDKSTTEIDITNKHIDVLTQNNYDIDFSFKWIIKGGGEEIIPIPRVLRPKLDAIAGGSIASYMANFKDATSYAGGVRLDDPRELFEGSRARKAANDMLVHSIELEKDSLDGEAQAMNTLREQVKQAQGHGHQLQAANALSAMQINQMMGLRNTMLAAEAQRAAEAQVSADKDARAIATARKMRSGLSKALSASQPIAAAP